MTKKGPHEVQSAHNSLYSNFEFLVRFMAREASVKKSSKSIPVTGRGGP
jgi:hypothetical protein